MASDGLRRWFERHPFVNGLFVIALGGGFFALLLPRLQEAVEILDLSFDPGAGRESVVRGTWWTVAIAAGFTAAAIVRRRWWTPSSIRRWVIRVLVALPSLGLLATVPHRSGDPPGAGFCFTWSCVASSFVVWLGVSVVIAGLGVAVALRASLGRHAPTGLYRALKFMEGPTGAPCRPVITAAPRDDADASAGWVYFVLCDCGFVGGARDDPEQTEQVARDHAPDVPPQRDIPTEASTPPPTPFSG